MIATARRSLARHTVKKFGAIGLESAKDPAMRVIEVTGNGRLGVRQQPVHPLGA